MSPGGASLFEFDRAFAPTGDESSEPPTFRLVGIDEAGRGPWAGPVVAAAVHLPADFLDFRLNDSKQVPPAVRLQLFRKIKRFALYAVGVAEVPSIDSLNILRATHEAMQDAFRGLLSKNRGFTPDLTLIDGRPIPSLGYPQRSIVQGDSKSACIAAASIVAKVTRDRLMAALDRAYPQYGFAKHKGYGTKLHQERLALYGPCPVHRKSFSPIREALRNAIVGPTGSQLDSNDELAVP